MTTIEPPPSRGEIWTVNFDPVTGHEQRGARPALVVSNDFLNHSRAGITIVLPITARNKMIRSHVRIDPPEGGLKKISFIKCEDIRAVSIDRFRKRHGSVAINTIRTAENTLRILLEL